MNGFCIKYNETGSMICKSLRIAQDNACCLSTFHGLVEIYLIIDGQSFLIEKYLNGKRVEVYYGI